MARCTITLLGGMQVTLDGSPLQGLESAKVRALLAYLVVESRHPHAREQLAGLFWPEMPEAQARQRLSQSLYNLRQVFGEPVKTGPLEAEANPTPHFFLVTPQTVQFNPLSVYWLDVKEFDGRLSEVQEHAHRRLETCEHCARLLLEAEQLYQGDFMTGSSLHGCQAFEEWALVLREHLRRRLCQALADLTSYYEAHDELLLGLEAAQRWVHLDPLNESAQRKLMRLLALDGQRTQALARYAAFRRLLMAKLGVEPGSETHRLYQLILAEENLQSGLPGMPGTPGTPGTPGALPVPLTPFVGRVKQLAELTAWLRDPQSRLITLLGPGGCGKTRLALQAARSLRYDFPDGIFLVSLSGLASTESFLPALAHALGVVFQANWGDPSEQLIVYLQRRHLLIILDSFEEALSAAHWVTSLLRSAPSVQVLVTSRARLNVRSEQVFPLAGMCYPSPDDLTGDSLALEQYSALQLFHNAARLVRPDYAHSPDDLPHLVRICQLVDGMPLGLVLAAGWLETCSPAEIAQEIEHSLDFLSSSWSDVPARQHSLRATLDHSWRFLSDDERQGFAKLSVFQSAFTRPAAQQVAQVSTHGLRSLVDKSMLQTAEGHYRMHDLLRQYAAEKLSADASQDCQVRDAHSAYFLERLVEREPRLKSARHSATLRELDGEISDMQVAWNWTCKQANIPLLSRSLEGLGLYYAMRVRYAEMKAAFQKALDIPATRLETDHELAVLRARLLAWLASLLFDLGELEAAQQMRQQAGELLDQLEAQGVDARCPRVAYLLAVANADPDLAIQFEGYQRAVQFYKDVGDDWRLSSTLCWAGELAIRLGDATLCLQYHQEALRLARLVGEQNVILSALIDMTYTYFILNQLETARLLMQEVADFAESAVELPARANAHLHLGVQLGWSGRIPQAIESLERALPLLRSLGYRYGVVYGSVGLGLLCVMNGEYARGEAILQANLPEAEQGGFAREAAGALLCLGIAALGRAAQAVEYFQESVRRYREMQFAGELGWALGGLALALEANGQPETAQAALVEALQLAEQTHSMFTMITCLPAMVHLLSHHSHREAALQMHRLALRQPMHQNSRWYADIIGDEMNAQWQTLPETRRLQIDASASQHTPFSILPEVLNLLE